MLASQLMASDEYIPWQYNLIITK